MSSRDVLYRSVLRGGQPECQQQQQQQQQQLCNDLSPMSNLALNLHHGASLSDTPRRRLSLSSNMTDTPQSCHDTSLHSTSLLLDDHISDPGSSQSEESPVSPSRRLSCRDKENFPSPYYSPSRGAIPPRSRASPLQDVQNTVNRNLSFSPLKKNLQLVSPSKRVLTSPHKPSPPDDCDTNSQDSGYSESGKKLDDECFSVPVSCAPRKLNLDLSPPKPRPVISPVKSVAIISSSNTVFSTTTSTPITSSHDATEGRKPFRKFSSLSKGDEEDTMLMDLMNEMTTQEEEPLGFSKLLNAPIQPLPAPMSSRTQVPPRSIFEGRPSIRRCLSMVDTPTSSRVQSISGAPSVPANTAISFKRPQPPTDLSNGMECKRRKQDDSSDHLSPLTSNASTTTGEKIRAPLVQKQMSAPEVNTTQTIKPKIQRSHSESHVSIMKALNKSSVHDGNLIGDFSKSVLLPTVEGAKHPDLKSVSVDTVAQVVKGEYSSKVASFRIIDCRYPYEFEGGHIIGAEMWYHPKMVAEYLQAKKGAPVITSEEATREILIFHCEFSAERGPRTQRLLREMDRAINKEHYPALHFPEMYLLEGGYKAFFEKFPELCIPNKYVRMLDSNHAEDLKHFRGKSKSWAAENKQSKSRNALPRPGLKRLGL